MNNRRQDRRHNSWQGSARPAFRCGLSEVGAGPGRRFLAFPPAGPGGAV